MELLGRPWALRMACAAATLAVTISLSGCQLLEHTTGQPIAIKRDGSGISVVVCADLEARGVTMKEREYPGAWETFWDFEKTLSLRTGDDISPSRAEEFGIAPGSEPQLTANHEIAVFVHGEEEPGWGEVTATFLIGADGLSETVWLHDDETVSSQPCAQD